MIPLGIAAAERNETGIAGIWQRRRRKFRLAGYIHFGRFVKGLVSGVGENGLGGVGRFEQEGATLNETDADNGRRKRRNDQKSERQSDRSRVRNCSRISR